MVVATPIVEAGPSVAGVADQSPLPIPSSIPKKLEVLFQDIQIAYTAEIEELKKMQDNYFDDDNNDNYVIREALARSRTAFRPIRELLAKQKLSKVPQNLENATQDSAASASAPTTTAADTTTVCNVTQKLDVLLAWENLVLALSEHGVFLEYVVSLRCLPRDCGKTLDTCYGNNCL